jgi:hypothetical protein
LSYQPFVAKVVFQSTLNSSKLYVRNSGTGKHVQQKLEFILFNHPMSMLSLKSLNDRRIQSLFPIVLYSILILAVARLVLDSLKSKQSHISRLYGTSSGGRNRLPVIVLPEERIEEDCNVSEGRWVRDNVSYPLYEEESCPYLVKQTTCNKNGRPDSFYKNLRWQPHGCNLPR